MATGRAGSLNDIDLRAIHGLCQGEHSGDWTMTPDGGPAERLVTGLIDVASSDEPPALAALQHDYRAVYIPDARLALGWGMNDVDSRDRDHHEDPPAWIPDHWGGARIRYAHIFLCGAMVWQTAYASVNWGSGVSGVFPAPSADYPRSPDAEWSEPIEPRWRTTTWEVEFARLLNDLRGNADFPFSNELAALSFEVLDIDPIDAERDGL